MTISRRSLLSAASFGSAMGLVSPGLRVAMAAEGSGQNDILVVVYLRGGSDGLQMFAPAGDANYVAARPTIKVPASGTGAGFGITTHQGVDFFVNPDAPELRDLFTAGDLAVVHAAGIPNGKRSHFESQDQMELGTTPEESAPNEGWLTRHIDALGGDRPLLGTVASAPNMPIALLGYTSGLAIPEVTTFNVVGGATTAAQLRSITGGTSAYKSVATNTLDAIATVQDGLLTTSNDPNAKYSGPIGNALKSLARLIKMDVGLDLATVDHHGWDHHDNLLAEFQDQTIDLSKSLNAFWTDLADYRHRLTVVTMTEFGRRVQENDSAGTDHGSASYMMVLSGAVNGGRMYGDWPGLAPADLTLGDLTVATDYRRVMSEILVARHGQNDVSAVFPTIAYQPLGLFT